MAKALHARRLKKLREVFSPAALCRCVNIENPIDWQHAEVPELRRYIELSKAAELIVAQPCEVCGKATVTADKSRLSTAEQIELQTIEMAVRERTNVKELGPG